MDPLTPISALDYTRAKERLLGPIKKFKGRRGIYVPPRSVLEEGQGTARNPRRVRAEVTLSALTAIVTHLGSLRERRTSVIFVSEGPPTWFADGDLEFRMTEILEAANRFNVTINVLDPKGLTMSSPSDTLWRLSSETGGRPILNTNGFTEGLMRVSDDASAYYLIGYAPTRTQADGKFHRIEVKVRRKGTKVLARKGYWAPGEDESTPAPAPVVPTEVNRALEVFSQLKGSRRAVTWFGFEPEVNGSNGNDPGQVRLRISWQPIRAQTADTISPVVLQVLARDGSDRVVAEEQARIDSATTSASRVGTAGFTVSPGPLKLTLALEAADGEILDRWTETIEVPAFPSASVTMGTPRVLVARSSIEYRAMVAAPDSATPTPLREFRRTDRVLIRTLVRIGPGEGRVTATLLNRTGTELAKLPIAAGADSMAQMELPVSSLAAGEYVLKLEAQDGADTATQHVAFRMVP